MTALDVLLIVGGYILFVAGGWGVVVAILNWQARRRR